MRAMILRGPDDRSLVFADLPAPELGDDDVLIRVRVCGVCRTDLDIVDGRLAPSHYPLVPGHQIVGEIVGVGARVGAQRIGERVGVAWINSACGLCRWCRAGEENLCPWFRSTGCDADGGYAELVAAPVAFSYEIPTGLADEQAAPLLCAGAIGWRSLALTQLRDGDPLGLTGFGASAHLVLQLARHRFPSSPIFVFARNAGEREFALQLGAAWAGNTTDTPPSPMAAVIDTTPAWTPVVSALRNLMPGGRIVINAIRKMNADRNALLELDYARDLWMEREIKSVANVTRADVSAMLDAAVEIGLRPTATVMPLEGANDALERMRSGGEIRGATVLSVPA